MIRSAICALIALLTIAYVNIPTKEIKAYNPPTPQFRHYLHVFHCANIIFYIFVYMENIHKVLEFMETGQRPALIDENEPTEIYEAIDLLRGDTYRFLTYYASIYEFRMSKIQRTTQHQTTEDIELGY